MNPKVDSRELVLQTQTTRASHNCSDGERLTSPELEGIYQIDENQADGVQGTLVIFDDMLTTGSHFREMKNVLSKRFPQCGIVGVFVSRRVPEAENPFEVFGNPLA